MGGKRFKNKICAYCAVENSVTGDHVFAREFFLPSNRAYLPQAPTCELCNNKKSKLEHYLTAILPFGGRHEHAQENLTQQVPKRLERNQRLHREISNEKSEVLVNENGEVNTATAVSLRTGQIKLLFEYIVKGLAWHHWHVYLSPKSTIEVTALTDRGSKLYQEHLFSLRPKNRALSNLGEGTVIYEGIQGFDQPEITVWRFRMYGGMMLVGDSECPGITSMEIGALSRPYKGGAE